MSQALFISDLHLSAERPDANEQFFRFLADEARRAQALYVLGDLFEYWAGDGELEGPAADPLATDVAQAFRRLSDTGTAVYIMHGNRDFLIGKGFLAASGARILDDPAVIRFAGEPVALLHGDTLCTDDRDYQEWRRTARTETWQREFLAKPVAERDCIVRDFREISKTSTASKKPEIMDVNQRAVEAIMREHGVQRLIHGHTHRPKEHVFTLDGRPARRMVLGDWYEQGSVLSVDARGWVLEGLPLEKPAKTKKMKVKS